MLVMTRMHWAFTHKWLLPVFLGLALAGCGNDIESAATPRDIGKEIVRAEIAGVRLNVPLNYMYQEAIEKRKHWPEPKSERVSVGVIHISVLLPDLRPYRPEDDARWKVRGPGERVEVSLVTPNGGPNWYPFVRKRIEAEVAQGTRTKRKDDIYSLAYFDDQIFDNYIPLDGRPLVMDCVKRGKVPFPGCSIKTDYRDGLVLEYDYGRKHLSQWKEVDDGLKRLMDSFIATASVDNK